MEELKKLVLKEIEKVKILKEKILKLFIYGSRLFGTSHEKSDYDVCAIIDGYCGILEGKFPEVGLSEYLLSLKDLDIEIHFYEKRFWEWKLEQNVVEAIASLSIPNNLIIYESESYKMNCEIHMMRLKYQVDQFKGIHEKISFQLFNLKNFQKGKKIACHCIRTVKYGIQVLEKGYVYDFHCAVDQFKYIMNLKEDYNLLKKEFYNIMNTIYLEFRKKTDIYIEYSPLSLKYYHSNSQYVYDKSDLVIEQPKELISYTNEILILRYIKLYGCDFKKLKFDLDIESRRLEKDLIQFEINSKYSTRQSALVEQCCGLIIDKNMDLICFPFKKFGDHINSYDKIEWKNAEFYPMILGISINLFYYKGEWKISYLRNNNIFIQSILKYQDNPHSFIENMFWNHWKEKNYEFPKNEKLNLMFTMNLSNLYLVGIRNLKNLNEEDIKKYQYQSLNKLNFEMTKDNDNNIRIVLSHANKLNPLEYQGIIVKEESNERYIFKSKNYWIFEEMTLNMVYSSKEKLFIDLFMSSYINEISLKEFILVYKQHKDWYLFIKEKVMNKCKEINEEYKKYSSCSPSELYLKAKGNPYFPLLQIMHLEKSSLIEEILFYPKKDTLKRKFKDTLKD